MTIILDDWQKEIVEAEGNILLCSGRQIGKTLTFAIKAAEYMIKNAGSQIIIVSLTEDQAKLIIAMILNYLDAHYKKLIGKGRLKPTQSIITLTNKSKAISRPVGNTGDAVRGFTADVLIVDEASRMPPLMWEAARPTLLTGKGLLWLCSTPHGKEGYFWESYQNKEGRFKTWHKTSEEVIRNRPISESWTQERKDKALKFLEDERKDMSAMQYGQEYEGLFLEDLRRFFEEDLILRTCILKRDIRPKEENYLGVDIGRLGDDESTFEILHVSENKIYQVESIITKKQVTTQTEERIKQLTSIWNIRKIGIDAGSGSLGVGIFDHLMSDPETKRKVVSMNNRQIALDREGRKLQRIMKEDFYDNLKAMMEHREILLLDDSEILASLRSIQIELTREQGQVTKVRIFGKYSHICEGLVRAAWLAKKEKYKKFFILTI